jgi:hypothetical protein
MATATRHDKLDKDVAINISREMEKILNAWREMSPGIEDASKRFDEKFRLFKANHLDEFEAEEEDEE